MKGTCLAAILLVFVITPLLHATEERYLCVPVKATGFQYNSETKIWEAMDYNPMDKYTITRSPANKAGLEIKILGMGQAFCWSEKDFSQEKPIRFECIGGEFVFDKKTGRFVHSWVFGYVSGDDNITPSDSPYVEIGECSPF